jgi:hypothetical protein
VIRLDERKLRAACDPAVRARWGLSLVAFHGQAQPEPLRALIAEITGRLGTALGEFPGLFRPYTTGQVHATILGLEGTRLDGLVFQQNAQARQRASGAPAAPMDLPGLFQDLERRPWPLPLQFGGHDPGTRNPHDLRPPWERAFDVREDGLAVLIGWPLSFAPDLLDLRKRAEVRGVVHKYHVDPAARDNDLFLVLGGVDAGALEALGERGPEALQALAGARRAVRQWLERSPATVELELRHLSVVEYRSTTLEQIGVERPLTGLDVRQLMELISFPPG